MPREDTNPEAIRQHSLMALSILDTAPEAEFDAIVRAARRIFGCRTSYISLIDTKRQWFKAREGFDPVEVPRECSICATAVEENREIVVEDLQAHPHYGSMPEIAAMPDLRFIATIPLMGPRPEGEAVPIGALCVIDDKPRIASPQELTELRQLAHVIETLFKTRLDARMAADALAERKDLVEDLRRTQRQFELAEQMTQSGHWRVDLKTGEIFWSKHTCEIHGVESADQEVLDHALEYFLPHDRPRITAAFEACFTDGTPYDLELDFRDAKGLQKRVRALGEVERHEGEAIAVIGVFQDITERYNLETRLRTAAHVDELTGLPNRARLNQFLDSAIDSACSAGRPLALLLIDLDHFKAVNDEFGHEAGDRVLIDAAAQLVGPPFGGQFAARLGGDEFVMVIEKEALLQDLDETLALLLEKLKSEVGEGENRLQVSATIGAAWLSKDNGERSALLRCADHALYQAKRAERGTAAICSDAIAGERLRVRPNLRAVG